MNPVPNGQKMVSSPTVESFWKQLEQSGLMSAGQVSVVARSLLNEEMNTDAALARRLVELGHLTRFQADRLLEGRSRGFFYDQYKVLDFLGVGGMSWVYRAEHVGTRKEYALKVLLDQFKNDRGMVVRFENEARAGLLLDHDNIVRTYAHGSAGGLPYLVMEYVQGPTVLELLRLRERNQLPYQLACEIARQAALGLNHVHEKGCVHRDIKPQNLLLDVSGHVKLLDFGLTMFHEGETGGEFSMAMIFGHECVGTAAFMAPEQATDSLNADARSDVYGLGCTLFAILTGDTPFPYTETKEVLKGHQSQIPRNVCEIVPTIPRPVGDIVAKMLAKNPGDRYATAAEVADALSAWSAPLNIDYDFSKILAERNRNARQKLAELQKRHKSSVNAANSTVKNSGTSSVASSMSKTGSMAVVGIDTRSTSSSIVRRDPYGFENPPAIVVRSTPSKTTTANAPSNAALKSEMVLWPLNGDSAIPLVKDRFLIGRGPDCDLQVQDASVSSRHCEIQFENNQWKLVDQNSRNGVRVNGDVVKNHFLKSGDTIIIGSSLRLRFGNRRVRPTSPQFSRYRSVLAIALSLVVVTLIVAAVFGYLHLNR